MRHHLYLARFNSLEKRLGLLGETHVYTAEETEFAREVVNYYDTIAVEGGRSKDDLFLKWVSLLYIPFTLAYIAGAGRSFKNDTAKTIAEYNGKKIIHLEENYEYWPSLKQKIAYIVVGAITIPLSPFAYLIVRKYGDSLGLRSESKQMHKNEGESKTLFSRLMDFSDPDNKKREALMAEKSFDILNADCGNLLIVCGEAHLDGIIENLHKKLILKEINSIGLYGGKITYEKTCQ